MPSPHDNRNTVSSPVLIREMLDAAQRAGVSQVRYNADDSVRFTIPSKALARRTLSMVDLELPLLDASGPNFSSFIPTGESCVKASRFSDAVLKSSRVLSAGAGLLLVKDAPEPQQRADGLPIMYRTEAGMTLIEPTTLAALADLNEDEDGPGELDPNGSTPQVFRAMVDLESMPTYAVRVKLSRKDQKAYFEGELANQVLWSISLGVARVADAVALAAIADLEPEPFTLAAAAARGLRAQELAALVGTDGSGGEWRQDGMLTAAGVAAELTPDAEGTTIGAFNRMAVAMHTDMTVLVERRDIEGAMELTVLVNCQALIPNTGSAAFWAIVEPEPEV